MAAAVCGGGENLFKMVVSAEYCEGVRKALGAVNVAALRETCRVGREALAPPPPSTPQTELLRAAEQGEAFFTWAVRRAREVGWEMTPDRKAEVAYCAAAHGYRETIESLGFYSRSLGVVAAETGQLALLQWLHSLEGVIAVDWRACLAAKHYGQTEAQQWLEEQHYNHLLPANFCMTDMVEEAAREGSVPVLDLVERITGAEALAEFLRVDTSVMTEAAEGGSVAVLRWLHDRGAEGHQVTYAAAKYGRLHAMRFLLTHGYGNPQTDFDLLDHAAIYGHMPVVYLLEAKGYAIHNPRYVFTQAAMRGWAEALQWMHNRGSGGDAAHALLLVDEVLRCLDDPRYISSIDEVVMVVRMEDRPPTRDRVLSVRTWLKAVCE